MDALETLFYHAQGDTGGSRRCAMFLLSLWNGANFKADLQELLYSDPQVFQAMIEILSYLYEHNQQLSSLVSQSEIEPVMKQRGRGFWDSPEPFPFPEP